MEIILLLALAALGFVFYKYYRLKKINGTYVEVQQQFSNVLESLEQTQTKISKESEALKKIQSLQTEHEHELIALTAKRDELNNTITQHQQMIVNQNNILEGYEQQYETIKKNQRERCLRAVAEAAERIRQTEENCKLTIEQKKIETNFVLDELANQLENERQKYLSIIETVQNAQSEDEKDVNRHIQIREAAKEDINYLLNNVANKLSNPDILYKLIWSEYIQKPTNEMLDYILPQRDCPGIYKITNDRNKKTYIGRSTSVRKRLTDHIKSAVGISTIADQRVHQAMREEGLWNFTFELIEECDKDKLNEREKFYIQFFSTEQLGYNQKAGG